MTTETACDQPVNPDDITENQPTENVQNAQAVNPPTQDEKTDDQN